MEETDLLPDCPRCGGSSYRRDSIFESRQEHGSPTNEFDLPGLRRRPRWLAETRRRLHRPGYHLAILDDEGEVNTFEIVRGWTRIGRSCTADVRLDDPSVSRRHALIVAEPGKGLRVLDDRSLNGVFVNGEAVEWGALRDGDELTIGSHSLHVLKR